MIKRAIAFLLSGAILLLSGCAGTQVPPPDLPEESGDIISDAVEVTQDEAVTNFGLAYQSQFGLNPYDCTNLTNRTILSLLYESLFTVTSNLRWSRYCAIITMSPTPWRSTPFISCPVCSSLTARL